MKKFIAISFCVIILCSLFAIMPMSKPPTATSKSELQTIPMTTPHPDLKNAQEELPQSALKDTPQITDSKPSAFSQNSNQTFNDKLEVTIDEAINYIARTQEPYALLFLNVLYRRFGIPEFKDSLQRYDEILSSCSRSLLKVLRRIADYNNTVDETDFKAIVNDVNKIIVPALYSDQRKLPKDYSSLLVNARKKGGYMVTHALLATIWLQENNCNISLPDHFMEILYYDTAALNENSVLITDLSLEAAAFLYLAGQGKLVHPNFAENVIAAQNPDGGWSISSEKPDTSDWHPTVLALIILLHVKYPATSYPPMLAPALS